jgi:hypothetical protein
LELANLQRRKKTEKPDVMGAKVTYHLMTTILVTDANGYYALVELAGVVLITPNTLNNYDKEKYLSMFYE